MFESQPDSWAGCQNAESGCWTQEWLGARPPYVAAAQPSSYTVFYHQPTVCGWRHVGNPCAGPACDQAPVQRWQVWLWCSTLASHLVADRGKCEPPADLTALHTWQDTAPWIIYVSTLFKTVYSTIGSKPWVRFWLSSSTFGYNKPEFSGPLPCCMWERQWLTLGQLEDDLCAPIRLWKWGPSCLGFYSVYHRRCSHTY